MMFINQRKRKYFRKKTAAYVLLLGILLACAFFLNLFFNSRKPLFISPLGKMNADRSYVEKILKKNNILFSRISLSENFYLVMIQNNGQVRLSQNKDIDKQIASLQRIMRELTIEGKTFKSIDFRFESPIISF